MAKALSQFLLDGEKIKKGFSTKTTTHLSTSAGIKRNTKIG
jgi:hypothetical protein